MSKGKQRPPQYNRQSKGYQQNLYKKQMKEKDVQMPKTIDMEKWTKINRIVGIVWIILTLVVGIFVDWKYAVVLLVIGILYMGGFLLYVRQYTHKFLKAYKQMGLPKDMYLKQLRRNGTDVKNINRMSKLWDKIKVEE